jgi:transcriptional regulator with XRE-family HTH domain
MPDRVRSQKQAQRRRAEALRAAGKTWGEIATVFCYEYGVNARVALRLAHGWSQGDAADRWNERWPDDLKTFKNISYWERWPAASGYTPSLDVLTKLAQLYECHVAELLSDGADNRSSDPVYRARRDLQRLPAVIAHASTDGASAEVGGGAHPTLDDLVAHLDQADVQDLARETVLWSAQMDPSIDRRTLLLKLGFALTVAAAAPDGEAAAAAGAPAPTGETANLSGIWRSEYAYYSTGRAAEFTDVHYVVVRQQDSNLSIESLPQASGSVVTMHLSVDGLTATGTWEERTSPTGYYKGAVYRGAIQLLLSPSGRRMSGRWIGFGKNFQINNGDWELNLESRSLSQRSRAVYEAKL